VEETHTVIQMSLLHVICYCCVIVSCVTKVATQNYINIMYQWTLCITVSTNLKFCTETDTYIIYPLLTYVPGNCCEFDKNIPIKLTNTIIKWKCVSPTAVYFYSLIKAYLAVINTIMTSTDVNYIHYERKLLGVYFWVKQCSILRCKTLIKWLIFLELAVLFSFM
jgi:hypothetical protein